jgi:hypothetical protein
MSDMVTTDVHAVQVDKPAGTRIYEMPKNDARRVMRWYWLVLCVACERHGVWPGEVLNVRRKSTPIAQAREDTAAELRRTVFWNAHRAELTIDEDGVQPRGAEPIATVFLKRLMGLDHSTFVLGLQRRARRMGVTRVSVNI